MNTVELRSSTGALSFDLVTPEVVASLSEPRQKALLALLEAHKIKDAAIARKNAAQARVYHAIHDEDVKRQAHEDASSPIPFKPIVKKLEEQFGRPLNASEMVAAREQHAIRVREHREAAALADVIKAFNSSH
jgi:hypothetical protein